MVSRSISSLTVKRYLFASPKALEMFQNVDSFTKEIINNARYRSILSGMVGGLSGWIVAELVVSIVGGPASFIGSGLMGAVVGSGIGMSLGSAESLVIQNWAQVRKGAVIGLGLGAIGGVVGALSAQSLTATTGGGSTFSTAMQERLNEAGAKKGVIEIALIWENTNDLDLHVIDPLGDRVWFSKKTSRSGGELDIDRNASCKNLTNKPVEHIVWTTNDVPHGTYEVCVHHFATCEPSKATPYQLEMKIGNADPKIIEGVSDPSILIGSVQDISRIPVTATFDFPSTRANPAAGFVRVLGWILFGLLVGLSQGVIRGSAQAIRNAALGGTIGGLLGGLLFETIAASGAPDLTSRLFGFMILGVCIGFCIVLVEQVLSAVLWITSGRQEGRQIFLDRPEMRLGRDDGLEVYLGGDQSIAPHHATIKQDGKGHQVMAVEGSVMVNNAPTSQAVLYDGDRVQLGDTRFRYGRREDQETRSEQPIPKRAPPPAVPSVAPVRPRTTRPVSKPSESPTISIQRDQKITKKPPPPPPPPQS